MNYSYIHGTVNGATALSSGPPPSAVISHYLKTPRLNMRPITSGDLPYVVDLLSDPAVMEFIGLEAGQIPSFSEVEQIVNSCVEKWRERGYDKWSVFDDLTGEFVGFCGFRVDKGEPELVCVLHRKFWGTGRAAEAARACLEYAFDSLGFTEINAYTRPNNMRARVALEKLGAVHTGPINYHGVEGERYILIPEYSQA